MKRRTTYQPPESTTALERMKMAATGALVAAGPALGWLILAATMPLGGHQ